jgi:tRNA G18 (ribose-2'-O)-methylase SpoU
MGTDKGDIETNYDIRYRDSHLSPDEFALLPRHPITIIVDNLRSAFNVGAFFRLCDILRAKELILCGYTAHPPHIKLEKTSLGTIDYVPWRHTEQTIDAVTMLKQQGIPVWAAETTSHSVTYTNIHYPREIAIVFGNEALGVSREVVDMCDGVVEIPVYGFKNSLNVVSAAAVIGFKFLESLNNNK